MLTITVEFLHGTYRADRGGLSLTGQVQEAEWPPTPLRLFAALVAADGTGSHCRHTDGTELEKMERWPPPILYASWGGDIHHQPLVPRFVVEQAGKAVKKKSHQEYFARRGTEVRPGARAAPRQPVVTYLWHADVSVETLDALKLRAARVGYLGCADSPVRLTVSTEAPDTGLEPFVPDCDGDVALGVPQPGVLRTLDAHFERWKQEGPGVSRSQAVALRQLVRYRTPGSGPDTESRPTVLWLRLAVPVAGRRVTALTGVLRAAVLDRYQRVAGTPPPVLHGHGFENKGYETARYLALPDVGYSHSRGRIHGLALWLPPDTDDHTVAGSREALHGLTTLVGSGVECDVSVWAGEDRPWASNPRRWTASSDRFVSAFPIVHERRTRRLNLAEVARWCEHSGVSAPMSFRSTRGPLVHGAVDLSPVEVNRPGRPKRSYSHVEIVFERPVRGPVVLGAARQFGLGLMVPTPSSAT